MGKSKQAGSLGLGDFHLFRFCAPRTSGPLGFNDQADPNTFSLFGDTPGVLGLCDGAETDSGLGAAQPVAATKVIASADERALLKLQEDSQFVLLAVVSYGEASAKNVIEEISAIASVIISQKQARGVSLSSLLGAKGTFAFASSDGNSRVAAMRKASPEERLKNPGMKLALEAARKVMDGGEDYSNGAFFWDGADISTNYAKHPKVKAGIKFTQTEHNIYGIKESSVNVTEYWLDAQKKPTTKVRGSYTYTYESTAAWGGTIFWKYGADFLKATGNKKYN